MKKEENIIKAEISFSKEQQRDDEHCNNSIRVLGYYLEDGLNQVLLF